MPSFSTTEDGASIAGTAGVTVTVAIWYMVALLFNFHGQGAGREFELRMVNLLSFGPAGHYRDAFLNSFKRLSIQPTTLRRSWMPPAGNDTITM